MIVGVVSGSLQAVIRLTVHQPDGGDHEIEAVIDTGYNGELTLPSAVIEALGLVWRRRGQALLADGSTSIFDTYDAFVVWDDALRPIAVDAADTEPLVGMTLLAGFELTIQVMPGGTITITTLP